MLTTFAVGSGFEGLFLHKTLQWDGQSVGKLLHSNIGRVNNNATHGQGLTANIAVGLQSSAITSWKELLHDRSPRGFMGISRKA